MNVDLYSAEVYQILRDKFGDASFRLFFHENLEGYKTRTGDKFPLQEGAPKRKAVMVGLSEGEVLIS